MTTYSKKNVISLTLRTRNNLPVAHSGIFSKPIFITWKISAKLELKCKMHSWYDTEIVGHIIHAWKRFLALCEGNAVVTNGFPLQSVMQGFEIFLVVRVVSLSKLLNKKHTKMWNQLKTVIQNPDFFIWITERLLGAMYAVHIWIIDLVLWSCASVTLLCHGVIVASSVVAPFTNMV